MNRSIVTISALIALGAAGCAGLGAQQRSTLHPDSGVASGYYVDAELGSLWVSQSEQAPGIAQRVSVETAGSDLWNPVSSGGSSDIERPKAEPRGFLSNAHTTLKF